MKSTLSISGTSFRLGRAVRPDVFSLIRRRMILDFCKWDPQIGDESVLLNQPMILDSETWARLTTAAEEMAAEVAEVELELLKFPRFMPFLGTPDSVVRVLRSQGGANCAPAVRTLRFDFHPTSEGWKVSEVNSDVPGGFTESSHFSAMMGEHYPLTQPAGNPLRAWTQAIISAVREGQVAILYAPGYMEDQQVATLLGATLWQEGCVVHFVQSPAEFCWRNCRAFVDGPQSMVPLDAIVRFYQGEWLGNLPKRTGWHHLFSNPATMVTNPGYASLAESKRLPLIWGELSSRTAALRTMFPECCEPREVDSQDDEWVFKAAYSNTGDEVIMPWLLDRATRKKFQTRIRRHPRHWVAQRRFLPLRVRADSGELSPCIGIFTINGKAAGGYVRLARGTVVDYRATEAAILIEDA